MALNRRQQAFCREYLVDLNATAAAKRAGYIDSSATGATAHDILNHPEVAYQIQREMDARAERTRITADRVLSELGAIAFADPSRVAHVDGNGLPKIDMTGATENDWRAVAAVKNKTRKERDPDDPESWVTVQEAEIKWHDKIAALEKIGKHLGMFLERRINLNTDASNMTREQLEAEIQKMLAIARKTSESSD